MRDSLFTSILSWITGSATALIAGFLPLDIIVQLVNVGTLSTFFIIAITVVILRRTEPDAPRSFRTPLVPFVPILCMLFCPRLIAVLPIVTLLRFVIWLVIGLTIYYLYGIRHSVLGAVYRTCRREIYCPHSAFRNYSLNLEYEPEILKNLNLFGNIFVIRWSGTIHH
jgi:amino acid transporter